MAETYKKVMADMKKAGIIGGIGPASTLDYYSGIINGVRAKTNSENYPGILINSINMTEMLTLVSNEDWESLVAVLLAAVKVLAAAGADFAAIASNTPHIVFDRIKRRSALPLISIVEATCERARAKNIKKAVIIGTRFTMSSGLYSAALGKHGIAAVVPSEKDQTAIHNIIFPRLEDGVVVPEDKLKMLEIVNGLTAEHRADALILACTELPLMIKSGDSNAMILNTTQIHIDAIVNAVICAE